jgi:hypothetical protein
MFIPWWVIGVVGIIVILIVKRLVDVCRKVKEMKNVIDRLEGETKNEVLMPEQGTGDSEGMS